MKQVKQDPESQQEQTDENLLRQDFTMTANMYLKCLQKNSKEVRDFKYFFPKDIKHWESFLSEDTSARIDKSKIDISEDLIKELVHEERQIVLEQCWVNKLSEMASTLEKLKYSSQDSYLAAYFVLHVALDIKKIDQALCHPYFWDAHEILWFISRAAAFFHDGGNIYYKNDVAAIKREVGRTLRFFGELDWLQKCENGLRDLKIKNEDPRKKALDEVRKTLTNQAKTHGRSIVGFLRVIRNVYEHYHDPPKQQRIFNSSLEVWNFFSNMYPMLICLLYRAFRALWKSNKLPDDLQRFFDSRRDVFDLTEDDWTTAKDAADA